MKKEISNPEQNCKESAFAMEAIDKKDIAEKMDSFFKKYSNISPKLQKSASRELEDKDWIEEVKQLDENTAPTDMLHKEVDYDDFSLEEFHQIDENDPGYVNDLVLDYDNEKQNPNNNYKETGYHKGAIRWGDYAVEGSEKYDTLHPGTILARWGSEEGTFVTLPGTSYDKLELPIVQEKQRLSVYEVCKPFPAEKSLVKKQPWNLQNSDDTQAVQYKLPVSIKQLVTENYLRLVEIPKEKI